MKVCLLLLVIVFVAYSEACSHCFTTHPQQHFCNSYFAMQVKIIREVDESDISNTRQFKAKIMNSWKDGPQDGKFKFYTPDAFCGSTLTPGRKYVITGSQEVSEKGKKYLLHGSCDFMSPWEDMSAQMKMGFRKQYGEQCNSCTVAVMKSPSDLRADELNNDFAGATAYWTPTDCYYNPHKSQQFSARPGSDIEDCEDVHGLCVPTGSDEGCRWKMTSEYKSCFKQRDAFAMVDSTDFAITDESQCNVYGNRRKMLKCRKKARKYQALLGAGRAFDPLQG